MLQFITNTEALISVEEQIYAVLEGGCRWIQIRMKEATDEEITKVVEAVKPRCVELQAFLLINDRVELAKTLDVGGVHVGKEDMSPAQARALLGPAAVIGVTANTFEDIERVRNLDIDYIGIGPYRNTTTKKNLAPILGLEGIRRLSTEMLENEIDIAHVAVGGIRLEDVEPLMEAGVNGIAVSGAIAFAKDPVQATKEFVEALRPFQKN